MTIVIYKKNRKSNYNITLNKGNKMEDLYRIMPKMSFNQETKFVKVKIKENRSKRNDNVSYVMRVYLSRTLLNELNWKAKDKINVLGSRSNDKLFYLSLSEDDIGFTLNMYKNSNFINFKCPVMPIKYSLVVSNVEYKIENGRLEITL